MTPKVHAGIIKYVDQKGDFIFDLTMSFKPETFYGKNISLLNNSLGEDRIVFQRTTYDTKLFTLYGKETYGCEVISFMAGIRNKVIWGDPNSIATTTETSLRENATVFGTHKHYLNRLIPWIREIWLRTDFGKMLGLSWCTRHELTLGSFSFELGRGISLGSAYAVGPEILGFYSDGSIDQFAFGGKLSGDVIKDMLAYDFYVGILQNKSATLGQTAEDIYGQEFGRLTTPERGFGSINFVVAGHLFVLPINTKEWGKLSFEPYFMYNQDPEQRLEFLGDSMSRLGTIGLACEYIGNSAEFGFDYAFNLGGQQIKGWDRNIIARINNNSFLQEVNSQVVDQNGDKIPFIEGSEAQKIINSSAQNASENGKLIGVVETSFGDLTPPIELFNSANRFRNPYFNKYQGWMIVADGGYWIHPKTLSIAATAGVASGDENPNFELVDGTYDGFIGLQEIYSGKRVRSAFVLGGAGRLKRPLSAPSNLQAPSRYSPVISGFTNLVFTGAALNWKPTFRGRDANLNPNIIFYWQEKATHAFNLITKKDSNQLARTFLGAEINTFSSCYILKDLRAFFIWSVFIPGGHYADIRGKPLNSRQQKALDRLNRTGVPGPVPNIGDDTAFTFNIGMEYIF